MRHGYANVLESVIKMDERDPAMQQQVGTERVRFRSHRAPIDGEIVNRVMALDLEDIEKLTQWRRDNAEAINTYPRTVLDAFHQDITDLHLEADLYNNMMVARWADAHTEMEALAARWLP